MKGFLSILREEWAVGTWKMRGSPPYSGGKDSLPHNDIFGREETKTKPQWHQSPNLTQTPNSVWMWEEANRTESDIPLNSHFSPHGISLSPHQPQGICFICVRFTRHVECFVGNETYEWDQCFHIMSQACLSVWWLMTRFLWRFQPKARLIHSPTNMCLTGQTQTAARIYGLNVWILTYRAPCCLIHGSIYHYKWNAWWATAGVNTTLEIRGL